ncbi:MAG: DNA methyltransferase [Pseudomonadota bacterium]
MSPKFKYYFQSPEHRFQLVHGDSLQVLRRIPDGTVDMIFADPPYFLSNGGVTCQGGKMVVVDKGGWDRSRGADDDHGFQVRWLAECQRVLSPNGTIWVSGTRHNIFSVGYAMQQLGFKLLNDVVWHKRNPPPNLACRYFTHATEQILWAARDQKSKHYFDYPLMKAANGGKQMQNVWSILPPRKAEKGHGKHPTQKPMALLERIILASTEEDMLILDPFNGSGTTGLAAARHGRRYIGVDLSAEYLDLTIRRFEADDMTVEPFTDVLTTQPSILPA